AALANCGYTPSVKTSGSIIFGQFQVERRLRGGITHYVDVHWRPAAPLVFDRAIDVAALLAAFEPLSSLGEFARGPAPRHALALACVHLVAHHWHQVLLVWMIDIRLLADALDDEECQRLVEDAVRGGYTTLIDAALRTTRLYFRSAGVDRLVERLAP